MSTRVQGQNQCESNLFFTAYDGQSGLPQETMGQSEKTTADKSRNTTRALSLKNARTSSLAEKQTVNNVAAKLNAMSGVNKEVSADCIRRAVVQLAANEIGVLEDRAPVGLKMRYTNEDPNGHIARYRTATPIRTKRAPYCAAFVSYLYKMAGFPLGSAKGGFASVPKMEKWFRDTNHFFNVNTSYQPKPGDVVFMQKAKTDNKGHVIKDSHGQAIWKSVHVGIFKETISARTIATIEGNTWIDKATQQEGVFKRTRDIVGDKTRIIGYGCLIGFQPK